MAGLQLNSPQFRILVGRIVRLYLLYIAVATVGHLLEDLFQISNLMPTDGRGDPPMAGVVLVSLATFIWTLFSSVVGLTFNARVLFLRSKARGLSAAREIELISIESIRAVAATLIRLPFFLIPGLFEWIRLTPIPFLVLFDSAYQTGDVDAVKAARSFFHSHPTRVLFFLMLSLAVFLLEFSMTEAPTDTLPLWQAPAQHIGSILLFSMLRLACDTFTLFGYASQFPRLTAPFDSMSN